MSVYLNKEVSADVWSVSVASLFVTAERHFVQKDTFIASFLNWSNSYNKLVKVRIEPCFILYFNSQNVEV